MEKNTNDDADSKSGYTIQQGIVFALTFASYLQVTALRKTQSFVKSAMVDAWVPNENDSCLFGSPNFQSHQALFDSTMEAEKFLGILDSIFMFAYALGLYLLGNASDRFEPRLVLVFAMVSFSLTTLLFGFVTEILQFYSIPFYICVWLLNAVCQSACWPGVVKIMDNWYGKGKRGLVFGVWASASNSGSIVGAYVSAGMLIYGYEYAFLVNSCLLLAISVVFYFGVVSRPEDIYGPEKKEGEIRVKVEKYLDVERRLSLPRKMSRRLSEVAVKKKAEAISFFKALLISGVIAYALAYGCMKSVNYAFFFWLPYYLEAQFGWDASSSATLSTFFDWGGIVGSVVCGLISDLLGKRSPVLVTMLIFSIASLGVYAGLPNDKTLNAVLLTILGLFINGEKNMVASTVTADLGSSVDSKEALSTVSGIIEGSGSFGSAILLAVLPFLTETFGWNSIFYVFMILLSVAVILLSKICYREVKEATRGVVCKIFPAKLSICVEKYEKISPPSKYGSIEQEIHPTAIRVEQF